jgi:hypothetical protein
MSINYHNSMEYYEILLACFRPFLDFDFVDSAKSISPLDICITSALAITSLLRIYRRIWTLEYAPSYLCHTAMVTCFVHMVNLEKEECATSYCETIQVLADLGRRYGVAQTMLHAITMIRKHLSIRIPDSIANKLKEPDVTVDEAKISGLMAFYPIMVRKRSRSQPENDGRRSPTMEKPEALGKKRTSHLKVWTPDLHLRSMKNMLGRMEDVLSGLSDMTIEEEEEEDGGQKDNGEKHQ